MTLLLILVFAGVFIVLALLLFASGAAVSKETRQTMTNLESVLAVGPSVSRDPIVDLRKNELLSAIPWINRWLLTFELAPHLRTVLYQANLKWTAGVLLMMSSSCFTFPAYLIYLRTHSIFISILIGLLLCLPPYFYILYKPTPPFARFAHDLPAPLPLLLTALPPYTSLPPPPCL